MKLTLSLLITLITFSACAQMEIKVEDAVNHVGDSVTIFDMVTGGKYFENLKGQPTFLYYGGQYPNAPLTLIIWGNVRKKFESLQYYKNSRVDITGKITLYKGKPEIVLYNEKQILSVTKIAVITSEERVQ